MAIAKNFATKNFATNKRLIMNPFKFGTIVKDDFFTDRIKELEEVKQKLNSENHLVLISPRRFGKSSLIQKALSQIGRPSITIDMMNVLSVEGFAAILLREIFRLYKVEKIKHLMTHFRIVPTISSNPLSEAIDVSFNTSVNSSVALEDAMDLLQKVSTPDKRLIIVLDEFQEVNEIQKGFDRQLRSLMQKQTDLNYVFLGSQESMMNEIFEKKKSPFYHFGQRMTLSKIPYEDFYSFVECRLLDKPGATADEIKIIKDETVTKILSFTRVHPYYSQQLSSVVYDLQCYHNIFENVVPQAIDKLIQSHDLDYERLWMSLNRTDRKVMQLLAQQAKPFIGRDIPTSTIYSALQRLIKRGFVIKTDEYEIEDPFFRLWIARTNI